MAFHLPHTVICAPSEDVTGPAVIPTLDLLPVSRVKGQKLVECSLCSISHSNAVLLLRPASQKAPCTGSTRLTSPCRCWRGGQPMDGSALSSAGCESPREGPSPSHYSSRTMLCLLTGSVGLLWINSFTVTFLLAHLLLPKYNR